MSSISAPSEEEYYIRVALKLNKRLEPESNPLFLNFSTLPALVYIKARPYKRTERTFEPVPGSGEVYTVYALCCDHEEAVSAYRKLSEEPAYIETDGSKLLREHNKKWQSKLAHDADWRSKRHSQRHPAKRRTQR